jgi:hypothetical protein
VPDLPEKRAIGRPRNDGLVPGSAAAKAADKAKAIEAAQKAKQAPKPDLRPAPTPRNLPPPDNASHGPRPGPFPVCGECYPDGWPKGATGLACAHGIWARPWVP